ncbi:hypothetical protein SLH46_16515 [Draconibacterium sp. IB214405]|uniref:hypothetical protein n=1 Tax=Draconibacterium sp. IB214405 TaxID=3097352 RepID=UPI002A0B81F7|nr:hypothetical protein [Draconibacterium sp. IB214405]MDX8340802.1 hypothetical protein [Draconibacterium sp. IB214405]
MKNTFLLLLIFSALLFSCDKIDEANTFEFDTTVSMDIPVAVIETSAQAQKSALADYAFSVTQTNSLSEIEEIADYLDKLKSIDINDLEIVISNLGEGELVKSIEISVDGVGVLVTLTDISMENTTFTPEIDDSKLIQAASILSSTKAITITVAGVTNTAPMDFMVNMDFDCHIEAKAL